MRRIPKRNLNKFDQLINLSTLFYPDLNKMVVCTTLTVARNSVPIIYSSIPHLIGIESWRALVSQHLNMIHNTLPLRFFLLLHWSALVTLFGCGVSWNCISAHDPGQFKTGAVMTMKRKNWQHLHFAIHFIH